MIVSIDVFCEDGILFCGGSNNTNGNAKTVVGNEVCVWGHVGSVVYGFGVVNEKLGTGQIFSTPPPFPLPTQKFHADLGDLASPLDLDRTLAEKIQLRITLDSSS